MNVNLVRTLIVCLSAVAANAANPPAFDAASIKLRKGEVTMSHDPFVRGRRVTAMAVTLADLITYAYNLRYDQIAGLPSWANSERFDLEAMSDGEGVLPVAECRQMTAALLADRFRLQVHRERAESPAYVLKVGKGGPKLTPVSPDAQGGQTVRGSEKGLRIEAKKATMAQLADQLSFTAGRPVLDQTGLSGPFAYTLDWFPANRVPPPDLEAPSMFAALQEQLGLRLETARMPVEKLVIDSTERPSEN